MVSLTMTTSEQQVQNTEELEILLTRLLSWVKKGEPVALLILEVIENAERILPEVLSDFQKLISDEKIQEAKAMLEQALFIHSRYEQALYFATPPRSEQYNKADSDFRTAFVALENSVPEDAHLILMKLEDAACDLEIASIEYAYKKGYYDALANAKSIKK